MGARRDGRPRPGGRLAACAGALALAACGPSTVTTTTAAPVGAVSDRDVADAVVRFRDMQHRLLSGEDPGDATIGTVAVDGALDALDAARAGPPLAPAELPAYDETNLAVLAADEPLVADGRAPTELGRLADGHRRHGRVAVVCVRNAPDAAGSGPLVAVLVAVVADDGGVRLSEFQPSPTGLGDGRPGVAFTLGPPATGIACTPDGAAVNASTTAAAVTAPPPTSTPVTTPVPVPVPTTVTDPAVVRTEVVTALVRYREVQHRILAGETVTEDDLVVGVGDGHHLLEDLRGAPMRAAADRPAYDDADVLVLPPALLADVDAAALSGFGEVAAAIAGRGRAVVVCVRNPPSSPTRVGTVVGVLVEVTTGAVRPPQVAQFLEAGAGLDGAGADPGVALATGPAAVGVRCPATGPPALVPAS